MTRPIGVLAAVRRSATLVTCCAPPQHGGVKHAGRLTPCRDGRRRPVPTPRLFHPTTALAIPALPAEGPQDLMWRGVWLGGRCFARRVCDGHPCVAARVAPKVAEARKRQVGRAHPPSIHRRELERLAAGRDCGRLVAVGGHRDGRTSQLHGVAMDGVAPEQHRRITLAEQVAGVAGSVACQVDRAHAGEHFAAITEGDEPTRVAIGGQGARRAAAATGVVRLCLGGVDRGVLRGRGAGGSAKRDRYRPDW
jgi:hypothetical protein